MTVAAFVLAVLGFAVGVSSLTWQVYTFLMQGARPKLTPVIGLHYGSGLVTNDATREVRQSIRSAAEQLPPGALIIGVKIVNAGRAPFHVAGWALRSDPAGMSFVPWTIRLGAQLSRTTSLPVRKRCFSPDWTTSAETDRRPSTATRRHGDERRTHLRVQADLHSDAL